MKITRAILPAAAVVLAAGLPACGSTTAHLTTPANTPSATSPAPVKTVTASPSSPQVNININNNPAPAPAPAPAPLP